MKEISAGEWEQFYNVGQVPWDDLDQEELINIVNDYSILPCTTLDIGCGAGSSCIELSKKGFDVTGIDISPTAIRLAEHRSPSNCKFEVVDIFKKSLNKNFHFIVDVGCFHYTVDHRFVEIVAQHLHPEGIWYSCVGSKERRRNPSADNIEIPIVPPAHSIQDIVTAVDELFEIISIRTFNFGSSARDTAAREGYPFWSCLMRKR